MSEATADDGVFATRHLGPNSTTQREMLKLLGFTSLEALAQAIVPGKIYDPSPLALPAAASEEQALAELAELAAQNQCFKSYLGMGYYNCYTPRVIQRNVLENPAWYTAYTPYQSEISQGRLEAMLNYQTMVTELTGMELANASLLDEATAAAEAMTMCWRLQRGKKSRFFVSEQVHPQTLAVVRTRAAPLEIEIQLGDHRNGVAQDVFGILLQYPATNGEVWDYRDIVEQAVTADALVVVAADLLSLALLQPPGAWGADVVVGNSQRFGVPLGAGGPHAAFFATREKYKRAMPGRLVGVSIDANGQPAYRLALQTREQHIRREKATSNICTAQVLLAVMAGMYAVYHGPQGLQNIALRVHKLTKQLVSGLRSAGLATLNQGFFDTVEIATGLNTDAVLARALAQQVNLRRLSDTSVGVALDETRDIEDVRQLWEIMLGAGKAPEPMEPDEVLAVPASLLRQDPPLRHPIFDRYHSETEMLRYLRCLADKDLALDRAMIPLGSCTMKLNASSEMVPVSWSEFAAIHPFAPESQLAGYQRLVQDLERWLGEITGYDAVSLQPNAGSQGEYAGLLAIRGYHASRGEAWRDVCLIPDSAHGTNPASAEMAGFKVVVVGCDREGNIDLADLAEKAATHRQQLAALMVTYPSTHGVFEANIDQVCELIHTHGGQVYLDGANLNAMVGLCRPGKFGADVSHLNLHKTFCIPHGGGGPGVGPIGVRAHLAPFLPSHPLVAGAPVGPVSAAPWGSASILPITWMYIRMMGAVGLKRATQVAILSANYLASRLSKAYEILYTGEAGLVAHECIVDVRPFKDAAGISVDDIAKRLIDYGFHAPTMSWPVPGTLMVEPTESEPKAEIDRFCAAMLAIHAEIVAIQEGRSDPEDNPLKHAPHTAAVLAGEWNHSYSRAQAVFPGADILGNKYWPPVGRVDNVFGDKNLLCSCPPLSAYQKTA